MKRTTWEIIKHIVMTLAGCAMMGAAFAFLTYPNSIVSGGLTGVGQIINLLTGLPVGVMVMVMNIPLFIVAWKKFGLEFILFSALGMVATSVFIDLFNTIDLVLTDDILLASVYGGLLKGAGAGLVYTAGATSGGTDIAARMLRRKYPYVDFGNFSLALDAVVVVAFAVIFSRFDSAMYTVITMFVASRVVNLMLYGMDNASVCYIITLYPEKLADEIGRQLGRGSTLLQGEGAYSGEERDVVLCVVKRQQIPAVKRIVSAIDPRAFVIVTESHQVFGKNFSNIQKSD
ncbi:MAG: YitT family protein [Oscillospiraceae bacterium]|nr:YitT family protein [Oscillospiraceae bacterium]